MENHICHMVELNKKAIQENCKYQLVMKYAFDQKKVKSQGSHEFKIGDCVLLNVKKRLVSMKKHQTQWIGPCTITNIGPGQLYNLEY